MAKPRKFYESLNQPSWKTNGTHRRPSPQAHGNPAEQSRSSSGGSVKVRTIDFSAFTFPALEVPESKPIPYAGVRTGELIGHRAWRVVEENGDIYISSLAHHRPWAVGETIYGDVNKSIEDDHWMWRFFPLMGGVYSHFTPELVVEQTKEFLEAEFPKQIHKSNHSMYELMLFGNTMIEYVSMLGVVYGTIECWGEVVEHELGYRSEYGKLKSLDRFHGCFDFQKLREKYLG